MSARHPVRVYLGFPAAPDAGGGGSGVNQATAAALADAFEIVGDREAADLQIGSFSWEAPATPRRLFIDHGSFADAGFWTFTAPKLRAADTILVSSRVCVRVAKRFLKGPAPRVVCVPFPIDTQLFRPAADREALRDRLQHAHGIPARGPLLVVAAAFVRRKNHHLALQFFAALRAECPDARLVFVGATPDRPASLAYRDAVRGMAVAAGLDASVHFLGALPQADLARLLGAADLLLHFTTCRLENFGLVVGEAMAAGLPVVAADWGGLRDLVEPGVTGLLAPTWLSDRGPRVDWLSLVPGAAELLHQPTAWRARSVAARERAVEQLAPEGHRSRIEGAVLEAATGSAPEGPPAFTAAAEELMFRTIRLNALHREIRDAGDEFRLLIPLDGGVHYRLLAGPAATSERAPAIGAGDRLYPAVAWRARPGGIEITDPVWPGALDLEPGAVELLERCDGAATIGDRVAASPAFGADRGAGLKCAQSLVDAGLLSPLGRLTPR